MYGSETGEHKDIRKSNRVMQIIKVSKSRLRRRIGLRKNRGGKVESLRSKLLVREANFDKPPLRSSLCVNLSELCQKIESFALFSE